MNKSGKTAVLTVGILSAAGVVLAAIPALIKHNKDRRLVSRYRAYYNLTNKWLENNLSGANISRYFESNGFKSVAIYGMGSIGELFCKELKKSGVHVCCFIDKDADGFYEGSDGIPVVGINGFGEYAPDIIVVTPFYDFEDIYEKLSALSGEAAVVSIDEIVFSVAEMGSGNN